MKELIEKKYDLIGQCQDIVNNAKMEKRALTSEEEATFNNLKNEVESIERTLNYEEEIEKMEEKEVKVEETVETVETVEVKEERAFDAYIRNTVNERSGELVAGTTGAVIPTSIVNKIMTKVYDICPVLEKSTRYTVGGNLELPYYKETTSNKISVAYASEFTALTSNSGEFDKIELKGFLAGALVKISKSLINNSQFNIVDFVVNEMAKSISLFVEKELLKGTSGKVEGLSGVTKTVTTASATAITSDEVIKLKDAVKDFYQNDAMFIMSNATRTALRLLKDDNGRYLLQDDITAPFGATLLGKPVYVSDNMEDITTKKTAIYYGNIACLSTKFSETPNIEVLREKFADEHAIGVIGWLEFDAKVADANGIAKLVMA